MKKLNLGSGNLIKEGYVNLDAARLPGVDVVHNLEEFPYPFESDTFDEVVLHHVIEHLSDTIKTMAEIHRISKNGAHIFITAPYFSHRGAFQDPTHKRFFTWQTFDYFIPGHKFSYITNTKFKMVNKKMTVTPFWTPFDLFLKYYPLVYERFFCWIFPVDEISYELEVIKSENSSQNSGDSSQKNSTPCKS